MLLQRTDGGPLLTRREIPAMPPEIIDPSSVFNPGALRLDDRTYLLLRVQTRGRHTFLVPAVEAADNAWQVAQRPSELAGLDAAAAAAGLHVFHVYDPRLTRLDGTTLVVTALDTDRGGRLAIWRAAGREDRFAALDRLELIGLTGDDDTRNGVLFPERINGAYHMLERPNQARLQGGPPTGDAIWLSASNDLRHWRRIGPVLSGRPHYWDELIGSGPPPFLTDAGWLHIYHGVATHFQSANIYQAGAVLLDRHDLSHVLGRAADNILEPREVWELTGQVPNVVFPSGAVVSAVGPDGQAAADATVDVFYGAADTVVGRASGRVADLVAACQAGATDDPTGDPTDDPTDDAVDDKTTSSPQPEPGSQP